MPEGCEDRNSEYLADGVHAAIARMTVLPQIEVEKFHIAAKLLGLGHRKHSLRGSVYTCWRPEFRLQPGMERIDATTRALAVYHDHIRFCACFGPKPLRPKS